MAKEGFFNKVKNFLFEEIPEEEVKEEENIDDVVARLQPEVEEKEESSFIQQARNAGLNTAIARENQAAKKEKEPKVVEIKQPSNAKASEKVVLTQPAASSKSGFMDVDGSNSKPADQTEDKRSQPVETETQPTASAVSEAKPDRSQAYRMATVISPIFGSQNADTLNFDSQPLAVDSEASTAKSYIGTVLSPITGNVIYEEVEQPDEVEDRIAAMQTNDFIETVEFEEPILSGNDEIIDAKFMTDNIPVSKPVITIPDDGKKDTIVKGNTTSMKMPVIQPVISPYEDDEDDGQMSLFDK